MTEIKDYPIGEPFFVSGQKWTSMHNYDIGYQNVPDYVEFYDVTLRDGDQTPGIVLREDERVRIACALNELKIPRIEAGMPAVSKDVENAMRRMVAEKFDTTKIYGFARAMKEDIDVCCDIGVDGIIIEYCVNPYTDKHVYGLTQEGLIDKLVPAINLAKAAGKDVAFMGWDWFRAPIEWTKWIITQLSENTQLDGVVIVDTFGTALPDAVESMFKMFTGWFPGIRFEFHGHNDLGVGNANSLYAVYAGAKVVHGAINGLGGRAGNNATEEMAVMFEYHRGIRTGLDFSKFSEVSELISLICKRPLAVSKPIVGANVYQSESGVGMDIAYRLKKKGEGLYPYALGLAPEVIGRGSESLYVLGKSSGKSSIRMFLDKYGLEATDDQVALLVEAVKDEAFITRSTVSETQFLRIANRVINAV